jgi:hypothetical protein
MTEVKPKKQEDHTPKVYHAQSTYLDPFTCDSTISCKAVGHKRYKEASIVLADCSRQITWDFGGPDAVAKLDTAIQALTDYRKALVRITRDCKKDEED